MIKLVAFDWNGTLFADTEVCCRASNKIFTRFGQKAISVSRFRQTFKVPVIKFYSANGLKEKFLFKNARTLSRIFLQSYEPLAVHCRSRGGARQTLAWLKKQGIRSLILSNHTRESIIPNLKRLGLTNYFERVIAHSLSSQTHSKNMRQNSKDKMLTEFLKKQNIPPREIIMVGDSEEEIEIGKRYGFHTVAITGGYNTTARLKKLQPDFLINNMRDLIGIVKKLNKHID